MKKKKQKDQKTSKNVRASDKDQLQERWLDVKEGDLDYDPKDPHGLKSSVKQGRERHTESGECNS